MKKTDYNLAVYCGHAPATTALHHPRPGARHSLRPEQYWRGVGGGTGLMGTIAGATLGCRRRGLRRGHPNWSDWRAYPGQTTLEIVDTMHQRKIAMIEKADAFVAMPGGPGTLEEFFEVFSWQFLDIHPAGGPAERQWLLE